MAATETVNDLSFASSRLLRRILPFRRSKTGVNDSTTSVADIPKSGQATPQPSQPTEEERRTPVETGCRTCPVCYEEKDVENFPKVQTCSHRTCRSCLKRYFDVEINESRIKLTCPECSEAFHPALVKEILEDDSLMDKFEQFSLRRALMSIQDTRWCPSPDCSFAVIAHNCASCPEIVCQRPGCNTSFCYHCKQEWHPGQTCDDARRRRNGEKARGGRRKTDPRARSSGAELPTLKACPRCQTKIMKANDGSCNHITCSMCNAEFCWLCLKEISDLHFLSPSGCTFWGRKPWSRKKKLLWQLGFLVGAPVGISLVAAITPPAMMIAVPIYYGKKVAKKKFKTKLASRLATAGTVLVTAAVSPVLAALTVGIGVPLLLIYVYGVIPFELCRNGGWAASVMASTEGLRLDFDEDVDSTSSSGRPSLVSREHSRDASHRMDVSPVADPVKPATVASVRNNMTTGDDGLRVIDVDDELC